MPILPRPGQKTAMISSTSLDLPDHRKQVVEACLRESVFPIGMEQLPVRDANAVTVDREMVDKADIYIGIFGVRYGEIPAGHDVSYTELEFNRAIERGIPILVFVMHKDHLLTAEMFEADATAQRKLAELKKRASAGRIRGEFKSPEELRGLVIQALADLRRREEDEKGKPAPSFHRHYDIPEAPEPFIAHPYTLLQTHRLVGRQAELNLLTDWVAKPESDVYKARILNIVAIGGMGKSALTWQWFNQIAPQEMKPLAGRMWWSFYESDASFENFVTRALAYVTRRPLAEVEQIPVSDREAQLLAALDREPFLIVLDGMERLLIAYARMDAAHLDALGSQSLGTQSLGAQASLPATEPQARLQPEAKPSFPASESQKNVPAPDGSAASKDASAHRKTADPRVGNFLRKLMAVKASRILISTRLYPAVLETVTGEIMPGCSAIPLTSLLSLDALALWRSFGVSGEGNILLPYFDKFQNHPLLIQVLAGQIARYRPAPYDFERWRDDHPEFDPFSLPLVQVKSHVLEFALQGLGEQTRRVLQTIAAFRMPASYDTLIAVLTGEAKLCASEPELDAVLAELEDRGLVGWDKRANRYDLHPIVRGVVWSRVDGDTRRDIYSKLHAHFEAAPKIDDYLQVNRLEDLTPSIELYHTLIGLKRYDNAQDFYFDHLSYAMFYRLSNNRQIIGLLETLFPDGLEQMPHLSDSIKKANTLVELAVAFQYSGQPGCVAPLFRNANTIYSEMKQDEYLSIGLINLSNALRQSGALCEAEDAARRAIVITRAQGDRIHEATCLQWIGLTLAVRGITQVSASILRRALRIHVARADSADESVSNSYLAQRALWCGMFAEASRYTDRAWELAHVKNRERDFVRAARMQGEAALGLGDFDTADERLHHALTRARQVNFVEEELPALIALAELRRRQNQPAEARELLDDVWEAAERGPYPLFHADAMNVLAQLERDASNTAKAIEAATQAYRLAWCDGPPYAYHWGLEAARKHLRELGAPEPEMPPFDPSKFEPMPEVEINPKDEFYVEIEEEA